MPSHEKKGKEGMIEIFVGTRSQKTQCYENLSYEKSSLSGTTSTNDFLKSIIGPVTLPRVTHNDTK